MYYNRLRLQPQETAMAIMDAAVLLFNYLLVEDPKEPANAIFVLGGSSLEPPIHAAKLYHEQLAPKVAFISTGGNFGGEKIWGMPENQKYAEVLVEAGVPYDAILTEGLTTNTLVEAQQAIPFLEGRGVQTTSLILVSRPVHQRRAWATFRKQHPRVRYINQPALEPFTMDDRTLLPRIVQEMDRLKTYGAKGDIQLQYSTTEIDTALEVVREYLEKLQA